MKKIIVLIAMMINFSCYAQNPREVYPVFFTSGLLTSVDSFNAFLVGATNYHLVAMDSSEVKRDANWVFTYSNNEQYAGIKDEIKINYDIICTAGNVALRQPMQYGIGNITIRSDFFATTRLFNRIFGIDVTAEQLNEAYNELHGPMYYKGQHYWVNAGRDMTTQNRYVLRFERR